MSGVAINEGREGPCDAGLGMQTVGTLVRFSGHLGEQASEDNSTGTHVDRLSSQREFGSIGIRSTGIRGRVDGHPGRQAFRSTGILGWFGEHIRT